MTEQQYDIVIIGAGPGGYQAAIRAAQLGAKVALIEKDKLGGTCLNRGCIPTKALYASAHLIEQIKEKSEEFGIEIKDFALNFTKAVERKNRVVNELVEGIKTLQKAWKNDVYIGKGKIIGGNFNSGFKISVQSDESVEINAKTIIIATGSSPSILPDFNIDHKRILTSDDILDPKFNIVPERLIIVGAGVSGCEFANIFNAFGSKVTLLEFFPSPIASEESMIVKQLIREFQRKDIEIQTSQNVLSIENTGSGVKATTCNADVPKDQIEKAEKFFYKGDYCLVSNGRVKDSKNFGLEDLGIKTDRGAIKVNSKTLETSVIGIYAIGDVTGGLMLAHVASYEGFIAVANALSRLGGFPVKEMEPDYAVVPSTIFTYPNISSVGLRRKMAKDMGIDVLMGTFPYSSLGKAKCIGEEKGFLMVLADKKNHKIIGASCIGAEAPELIAEMALAIRNNLRIDDVVKTIHCHPTLSEMVFEGCEATLGMAIHKKGRPLI